MVDTEIGWPQSMGWYNHPDSIMDTILQTISTSEAQINQILEYYELPGRLSKALAEYAKIERKLMKLEAHPVGLVPRERARVQAVCLDREVEILLQFGRLQEAFALAERQLSAARFSGDLITLAYALLSAGQVRILNGDLENGKHALAESLRLFNTSDSNEHTLGLGRYWSVQANLINQGLLPGGTKELNDAATQAMQTLAPLMDRYHKASLYFKRAHALCN